MKNSLLLFLILISFSLNAQSFDKFNIKAKTGLAFSGLTNWSFTSGDIYVTSNRNPNNVAIKPGLYFGIGIESGEILSFDRTFLTLSAELSYGKSSTGNVDVGYFNSEFQVTSMPLMLWASIKSQSIISPYIRIGIGIENSEFEETYQTLNQLDFKLNKNFFCYGIGAGIDYSYTQHLSFSLFADAIIKERGFYNNFPDGRHLHDDFRSSMFFSGLEVRYNL